jgi:3',5'-cyclic AMP phosphodiesterase CpdA
MAKRGVRRLDGVAGLTEPEGAVSILGLAAPEESAIVRIGHISDLHIADRARYPRNGFSAKDCDRHSAKLAKGLLDALREVQVDHLVVTGDLTLSSEPREFERAADMLSWWAAAGKLTVVPGNHDVWTADAVDSGRFLRAVGADGNGMRRPVPTYPHVVPLGEVVLVALDSARFGEAPRQTAGRIGADQLRSARELCRQHQMAGKATVLALHHHVVLPPERVASDVHVARMPLADADQVIRLVAELPVAAVLHGHRHCAFRVDVPGASHPTPILCAGSVSRVADEPVRRARAYLYDFDASGLKGVEALISGTT